MFIEFENKIKIANNIAVFIEKETQLENILYLYYTKNLKKKKNRRMRIFLSFLAGKLRQFNQKLLTE